MRLTDLEPKWTATEYYEPPLAWNRTGMGISFLCPHCRDQRLAVMFSNPIDGLAPAKSVKKLWSRVGNDFDRLTIHPSIDASKEGHWHGSITNGEVE